MEKRTIILYTCEGCGKLQQAIAPAPSDPRCTCGGSLEKIAEIEITAIALEEVPTIATPPQFIHNN